MKKILFVCHGNICRSPIAEFMLMSLCGEERDVADPWYTGDFERTYRDIDRALQTALKMTGHE